MRGLVMKSKNLFTAGFPVLIVLSVLLAGWMLSGCNKESSTTGPLPSTTMVKMAVSFSNSGAPELGAGTVSLFTDSLHIDSAVVVISRIKFLRHSESESVDSGDAENDSLEHDESISFRGPFVVHVQDTVGINFGNQEVPAGNYDGIKFKIHRLRSGKNHKNCD